ncbi:hypothetical protein IG631_22596 [Alternaria alternata]|nr:hypothetical protein IG631_22596 [Alternaria alternata]
MVRIRMNAGVALGNRNQSGWVVGRPCTLLSTVSGLPLLRNLENRPARARNNYLHESLATLPDRGKRGSPHHRLEVWGTSPRQFRATCGARPIFHFPCVA